MEFCILSSYIVNPLSEINLNPLEYGILFAATAAHFFCFVHLRIFFFFLKKMLATFFLRYYSDVVNKRYTNCEKYKQILISLFSLCMKFHCACDFFPLIISEAASEFLYPHTTSEHAVSSSKKVFNTEVLYMYAIHRTTWNFPYCIQTVLH